MTTAAEPVELVDKGSSHNTDAVELSGITVRFSIPSERISSFKEYVLRRLTGSIEHRELFALRNVSLRVRSGEFLGVVGRNGAGKTTLLKVISRVLYPTRGRVAIRGRTAPLLGLGAGFHFDLTGRENVFLNAALLRHPRRAVERRLAEVIAFSELADFFDVPIRNYSSGMLARLGFSVATMFRPDVLLVDEVLAVGDAAFREKCLARIQEFRNRGTTILLVSHQTGEIADHCDRVLWLEQGEIAGLGKADAVLAQYGKALTTEHRVGPADATQVEPLAEP